MDPIQVHLQLIHLPVNFVEKAVARPVIASLIVY